MDNHRTTLIAVAVIAAAAVSGCGHDEEAPRAAAPKAPRGNAEKEGYMKADDL